MSGEGRLNIVAAYQFSGTYRGAAVICGTMHETVKKVVTAEFARLSGHPAPVRKPWVSNTEVVRELVVRKVMAS